MVSAMQKTHMVPRQTIMTWSCRSNLRKVERARAHLDLGPGTGKDCVWVQTGGRGAECTEPGQEEGAGVGWGWRGRQDRSYMVKSLSSMLSEGLKIRMIIIQFMILGVDVDVRELSFNLWTSISLQIWKPSQPVQ